ncbi:hypothetical protein OG866_17735 [Streptomyces sp. NBC_00663]|uniref:hypothetical protein n=1 Tax=Streptomyces sp. NBC_00663 TaxID=2975801 RepID=UPI002E36BCDE|nr:hypothetical protein [Streptomyces sp. NBC_00663]
MVDLRAVLADFPGVTPLAGLSDAWYWSSFSRFGFAGALSADGERLLQVSGRDSYDEELAVAVLGFAREREGELFARNAHWGALGGFQPPPGRRDFDVVVGVSPDVHRFYSVERPELTPHVRLVFPAYACEFSAAADETLDEAVTRYRMLRPNELGRDPLPYLRMRYANTRTQSRSTNRGRGFTEPRLLVEELRWMEGAEGSFVEFENRHGRVWRVEWHGGWFLAEHGEESWGAPREVGAEEVVQFATARLYDPDGAVCR